MIRSLTRFKFIDQTWSSTVLDDLANYWLRLCQIGAGAQPESWAPDHLLELRLTGFPRAKAGMLRDTLTHRYSTPGLTITSPDADTLVISWEPRGSKEEPPEGLGLPILVGGAFEGLIVEIRFAVVNERGVLTSTTCAGYTLVLVGELRGEALFAKSLWGGRAEVSEAAIQNMPTPWENELLSHFDRFRTTAEVPWGLAYAPNFPPKEFGCAYLVDNRILDVPFGRPRLRGLLIRGTVLVFGFVALVYPIATAHNRGLACCALPFALLWCFPLSTFLWNEFRLLVSTYAGRAEQAAPTSLGDRYAALTPEQLVASGADPAFRKYTADALGAGFTHFCDLTAVPFERTATMYRIFHAPDGAGYLVLVCATGGRDGKSKYSHWPIHISFECQTFFSDGGRVDSVNHETYHTYAENQSPTTRLLAFPEATDPISLYRRHTEVVATVLAEASATPLPHEPLDAVIRRQERISEAEHRGHAKRRYSWRDHLRWYLQLDTCPSDDSK
jgi:hypothetical protein